MPEKIDARVAYEVWLLLIADEELYRAMIAGTHRELAGSRKLDATRLAVLDAFRAEPGTAWNIENLRFRTALEVSTNVKSYMPRTVRMLTNGDDNWLQDIAFEYLSYHRWHELGHHRLGECERFAEYTRERIAKRRIMPPHLDSVLGFELAVVRLLKRTASIAPERWPKTRSWSDGELRAARLRLADAVVLHDSPVDIRAWVESGDPLHGTPAPEPVTFLLYVPSLEETHRVKLVSEGVKLVLERFDGARPTERVAAELEDEFGLEASKILALVRTWLDEHVLTEEHG